METLTTKPQPSCNVPGVPQEPVFLGNYIFNTGHQKTLSTLDYVIFVATLAASSLIGFNVTWRNRNSVGIDDYLLAGRNMGPLPVGLSLVASFMSAITMIGLPAEIYVFSTMYIWIGLSYFFVCASTAHIYMPVFYQLRITSVYEYLQLRFSRGVRRVASFFFLTQMIIYTSLVLSVPSVAIHQATGLNLLESIISVSVVSLAYTAWGGVKAVIWTDFYQCVTMIFGLAVVVLWAQSTVLSWGDAIDSARRTNRLILDDFRTDLDVRHSVWSLLIGGYFTWVAIHGCTQVQVHRCLTCRTLEDAKLAVWINLIGLLLILVLCCMIGLYMAAFYENCDPIKANLVEKSNQLVPLFVMDTMGDTPGLSGIFLAAIFCGALSTVSSGLTSMATAVLEDFLRTLTTKHIRAKKARIMTQVTCIIFGIVCLELAYLMVNVEDILTSALLFNGGLTSPVLGVFSLGMFFPWANAKGAWFGLVCSFVSNCALIIGTVSANIPPPDETLTCVSNCNMTALSKATLLPHIQPPTTAAPIDTSETHLLLKMSYMWLSASAYFVCIGTGLLVSLLTGLEDPKHLDARLIVPLADVVFPFFYLPENLRNWLRFGIVHDNKWDLVCQRSSDRTPTAFTPSTVTASVASVVKPSTHGTSDTTIY